MFSVAGLVAAEGRRLRAVYADDERGERPDDRAGAASRGAGVRCVRRGGVHAEL